MGPPLGLALASPQAFSGNRFDRLSQLDDRCHECAGILAVSNLVTQAPSVYDPLSHLRLHLDPSFDCVMQEVSSIFQRTAPRLMAWFPALPSLGRGGRQGF